MKAAADQAAAEAVIAKIAELPASVGTGDKAAIEAARAAYDALTEEQKALLSAEAVGRLTDAEAQLTRALSRKKLTKSNTRITVKAQTWTGKALKPKLTVKVDGKALKQGTDYTVSYKNNINVGKAKVTIVGVGSYTGTLTGAFKIKPKKVSGLKLKAGAGKLTVSWTQASGVTGYEVQYGTKSSFTGAKTATVKRNSKIKTGKAVKATLKKLKSNKAYYVRIRAYKTVKGVKYYSSWSKAVKQKTK